MKVLLEFANKRGVDEAIKDIESEFVCKVTYQSDSTILLLVNKAYIGHVIFNTNEPTNYSVVLRHEEKGLEVGLGVNMYLLLNATQSI